MTGFDLSTATNITIGSTQASAVYLGNNLIWPTGPHDYSQDYFTIVALESGSFNCSESIKYSTNGGTDWTELYQSSSSIYISAGTKLLLKYDWSEYYNRPVGNITLSNKFNVEGNIMSLLYGDNFRNKTVLNTADVNRFNGLLKYNKVVSAENLILPATTLANSCYIEMFKNCSFLTNAPELPATTLANSCYNSMFTYCSSLTNAPELPATVLTSGCYNYMFRECTSLNYVKMMALSLDGVYVTAMDMLDNVAASGTFVKNINATWNNEDLVPSGWTVQNAS